MKDMLVGIVMAATLLGALGYPFVMSRGSSITGANVFTTGLSLVVFPLCVGYFTKFDFRAMVLAFSLLLLTLGVGFLAAMVL